MATTATLDEINDIHDDDAQRAAAELRSFDATDLPADRLPMLAFLLLHVLGEKLGEWAEAADRLEHLRIARTDAPLAVAAHAAAAAQLAGWDHSPALAGLQAAGGAVEAETLTALAVLGWRPAADAAEQAAELEKLAAASLSFDAGGPLNQRLAIALNNTTSHLLDATAAPVAPAVRSALLAGSEAALRFWQAAGTWVNLERALYLRALVHNRIGEPAAARLDCQRALEVIAANEGEEVDQAFLQLQLAGALLSLGETAEGRRHLAEARAAVAQWDDAGLKSWFAAEQKRLFGEEESKR
jgi:hypothetical protein